jgi:hypothetical protein
MVICVFRASAPMVSRCNCFTLEKILSSEKGKPASRDWEIFRHAIVPLCRLRRFFFAFDQLESARPPQKEVARNDRASDKDGGQ